MHLRIHLLVTKKQVSDLSKAHMCKQTVQTTTGVQRKGTCLFLTVWFSNKLPTPLVVGKQFQCSVFWIITQSEVIIEWSLQRIPSRFCIEMLFLRQSPCLLFSLSPGGGWRGVSCDLMAPWS